MNDMLIAKLIREKNEEGIAELIKLYGKVIYGVIYKTLVYDVEKSEVEFIFNDILFNLWNSMSYYDYTQGKLVNYIISVAKFTTIDYIRKNNKRVNDLSIDEELIGFEETDILSDKEKFLDLISPLSDTDKSIFIRRFYFRDSIKDIAESMMTTPGSISNKILRGKKKLKEYITSK